ncbi:MAG: hypothetical protein IPM47_09515 [Sphingobacteriales bacterium]|nr:MAG: hypothetical protein IPM47_09515 [Sphingobacteriales bacterium]
MKKNIYFVSIGVLFAIITLMTVSSCTKVKQIGRVNMISNRNVDPKLDYSVISTYSGGSQRELKKTRAVTLEDAIDQTVRKIPGGEFLMNARLYVVNKKYYAVEGDVWGVKSNIAYRGFKVGDKVIVDGIINSIATIKSLKDDKTCFIERINGLIEEVRYDRISKAE